MDMFSKRKIFSTTVGLLLLGALMMTWLPLALAGEETTAASTLGYIDYSRVIMQHPDTPKDNEVLKAEVEKGKQEYIKKSAGLGDKEKRALDRQIRQRINSKKLEMLEAVVKKIQPVVKSVADARGLTAVVEKRYMVYGGVDITEEVIKKITGK